MKDLAVPARRFFRLLGVVSLGLAGPSLTPSSARAEALADSTVHYWSAPVQARVMSWGGNDAEVWKSSRDIDASKPVWLGPDDLLIVPVTAGAWLRTGDGSEEVGLGTGHGPLPDVITWLYPERPGELRVPTWSSARFVVIRKPAPGFSQVHVATTEQDALRWHRFDARLAEWLSGVHDDPPAPPAVEAAPLVRWLEVARSLLEDSPPAARTAWLLQRWLAEAARLRPLVAPYFLSRAALLQGGREVADDAEVTPWSEARAGERLRIGAPGVDVLRFTFRTETFSRVRLRILEGDLPAREILLAGRPRPAGAPWPSSRVTSLRAVVPPLRPEVTVVVLEGRVQARARAFTQRTDLFHWGARTRDREAQLEQAGARAPGRDVLATLAALDGFRSARTRDLARARWHESTRDTAGLLLAAELLATSDASDDTAWLEHLATFRAQDARWIPLRRSVFERWVDSGRASQPGLPRSKPPAIDAQAAHPDDREANRAFHTLFWPTVDEGTTRRPDTAWRAELLAASTGSRDAVQRARRLWRKEGVWTSLSIHPDAIRETVWERSFPTARPGDTCPVQTTGGVTRWRLLEGTTNVTFEAPEGHYARVVVTSAEPEPTSEPVVRIDGTPITIHALSGLLARVAVAPGARTLQVLGPAPVLARIPGTAEAPCDRLHHQVHWARTEPAAPFFLEPHSTPTIVRVSIRPGSLAPGATDVIRARAGDHVLSAWVRTPATGALEGLLPTSAAELWVSSERPLFVRTSARLRPRPPGSSRAVRPSRAPTTAPSEGSNTPATAPDPRERLQDHRLEQIRATTAALVRASASEAPPLRRARAQALRHLGFWKLAGLDEEQTEEAREDDQPPDPDSVLVYGARDPVIPLGWTPRLPPLAAPRDEDPLRRARALKRARAAPDRVLELLEDARDSTKADALLLALEAYKDGRWRTAAETVERLAWAHDSAAAFERAATLWADEAARAGDRSSSLRSLMAAHRALALGGSPSGPLARLRGAIRWVTPEPVGVAGSVLVEHRHDLDERSLAERVYRTILGAPEDAALFFRDRQLELRLDRATPAPLVFTGRCLSLSGPDAACGFEIEVNGARPACRSLSQGSPSVTDGQPWSCAVDDVVGSNRVQIRLTGAEEAVAWVALDFAGDLKTPVRSISRWSWLGDREPRRLLVVGPTVVHVRARRPEGKQGAERRSGPGAPEVPPAALRLTLQPREPTPSDDVQTPSQQVLLRRERDPAARPLDGKLQPGDTFLTQESEGYLIVPDGPHWLEMTSSDGPALIRLGAAVAHGVPRARAIDPDDSTDPKHPPTGPVAGDRAPTRAPAGRLLRLPEPGWLTVRAYAAFHDKELTETDQDPRSRFAELGVGVHRELWENRLWLGGFVFTRPRFGPDSQGTDVSLDMSARGWAPGVFVRGHLVRQSLPEATALGGYGTAGLLWSIPLAESLVLVPSTSVTARSAAEEARFSDDVDPSVFTAYAADHPWTPTGGLRVDYRPLVDTILRLGASARMNPGLTDVDRIDLRGTAHTLPGEGLWPWLTLDTVLSHRPVDEHRSRPFWRLTIEPRATFWSWVGGPHRVSLSGHLVYLRDWPETARSGSLSSFLAVGYDWTANRGLSDLPPRERLFRDRLEEGSGYRRMAKGRSEATWEAQP